MKRSKIFALALGIGTLALAGGGGAYCLVQAAPVAVPAMPVAVIIAATQPVTPGADWHSLDNYLKIAQTADDGGKTNIAREDKRAERQAELRRRLQPPMLPLILVADAMEKISPKSHWDEADASQKSTGLPATVQSGSNASSDNSLVSNRTRETLATMEAFRMALQQTGGTDKFNASSAVPYIER